MRISQIMLAKGFGGAERHFVELSRELASRGAAIQAICNTRFRRINALREIPGVSIAPVRVHGSWDRFAGRRIKHLLNEFQPHTVHTHLARASLLGGRAAHSLSVPVVANMHNYVNLRYYRNVDHFIAATGKQVGYLSSAGFTSANVTRIPHFSAPRSSPNCRSIVPVTFAALGRFVAKKGFNILIDAFRRARSQGLSARLILAGDGPERSNLCEQVARLRLDKHVDFLGWVDDPYTVFSQSDIFVLPSLEEPFGIVVLEAAAAKIPIICTRTDGPLEILDEQSAYFANTGCAGSLANAMIRAAIDRFGRHAKACAAHARFEAEFTPAIVIPKYMQVYAAVTQTAGAQAVHGMQISPS